MKLRTYTLTLLFVLCVSIATNARGQEKEKQQTPPPDMNGMEMDAMNKRGDHVMGFDHTKTSHHFFLKSDGGVILVEAIDVNDMTSRDEIRMHLGHIAMMFAEGNFKAPMLIHEQTPPGVPVMKSEKAKIEYSFENTDKGGRVIIKTKDTKALKAVHEFLRFQIREHQTGDPVEMR